MESERSTTRTYTANTCELIVSGQEIDRTRDRQPAAIEPTDFHLHIDRSELGEERLTLQGQPRQLNHLQQVVSSYIAELVAKFPIPVTLDPATPATELPESIDIPAESHSDRAEPSARSGILKNLPGLRNSLPENDRAEDRFDGRSGVSKLFGIQPQSTEIPTRQPASNLGLDATTTPDRNTPYLTGSGDRSLDHYLHLGDLATPTSGEVVTLSALQLFDLAIVLDEYAKANLSLAEQQRSATLSRTMFQSDPAITSRNEGARSAGLPNIPRIGTESAENPIYYRNRHSSRSFMSGIPWAIAAAMAVGLPLAMLDPNPNPLKDTVGKIDLSNLTATKKSGSAPGKPQSPKTNLTEGTNPNTALPSPWQQQPILPPASSKPTVPSSTPTPATGKLGAAPLPSALAGKPGQVVPAMGTPDRQIESAKNPLESSPIPPNLNSSGLPTSITPTPSSSNPGTKTKPGTPATTAASTAKPPAIQIGQLPIDTPSPGKISISKQPAPLPPTEQVPKIDTAPVKPVPFNPPGLDESGRIDPFNRPTVAKPADGASKPAVATKPKPKPKPGKPKPSALNPSANDPFIPVPTNPNLIDPNNNTESTTDPQVQQVVPDRPLPTKSAADPAENNPTLQETKRYFQGKWKATPTQTNVLQYVLQVNKNGTVKSVSPQGEAANTYLQQTKFIKPGQKLAAPTGSNDQKIRVLLQPDGSVDTFIEP